MGKMRQMIQLLKEDRLREFLKLAKGSQSIGNECYLFGMEYDICCVAEGDCSFWGNEQAKIFSEITSLSKEMDIETQNAIYRHKD